LATYILQWFDLVSDLAVFVLKRDIKLQPTNSALMLMKEPQNGHSAYKNIFHKPQMFALEGHF